MAGLSLISTGDIHNLDQEKEEGKNSMPHFDALTQIFVTCAVFFFFVFFFWTSLPSLCMMRVAFSAPSHDQAPRNTLNNLCFVQAKCHGLCFLGLAPKLLSCGGQADVLHSMPSEAVSLCNLSSCSIPNKCLGLWLMDSPDQCRLLIVITVPSKQNKQSLKATSCCLYGKS